MINRYVFLIEPTVTGFSAFAPDLPGCVATGPTRELVEARIREAIEFHIEGLRLHHQAIPEPTTLAGTADVTT